MYIGYHHNGLRWKVRYVVHDDGRTSDKIWPLVSPRCQEVIFPGSSTKQLKIMLWFLFLIDCKFIDFSGSS